MSDIQGMDHQQALWHLMGAGDESIFADIVADIEAGKTIRNIGVAGGVTTTAPNLFSNAKSLNWNGGGSTPITVRTVGDGVGDGTWNVMHAGSSSEPYILHLTHGGSGGSCIGIGVSPTTTGVAGILIDNYTKGVGLLIQQINTISDPTAYGFYGDQRSNLAPLMKLAALPSDAAPLLQIVGAPSGTTHLLEVYFNGGSGFAGYIEASDGSLVWRSPLVAESGNPTIRVNATSSLNEQVLTAGGVLGTTYYGYSGSAGLWYATSVRHLGDELHLQASTAVAAKGSEVMLDGIVVKGGAFSSNVKLGFYGATPVNKPTGVAVTAAGIHAALVSLGLIAA